MNVSIETILNLDKKWRMLILFGTLFLIAAVYVYAFYVPSNRQIEALENKLDAVLAKKAEQEAIIQNIDEFKQENQRLKQTLQLAMAQLPDKKEIHSLLQSISNIAREAGLKVPLFKPGNEIKKDFYAEVPVDINLVGSHGDLLIFFDRVGQSPRIVNISNLTIKRDKTADAPDLLNISCKATTYRFLEESERPRPEADTTKKPKRRRRNPSD